MVDPPVAGEGMRYAAGTVRVGISTSGRIGVLALGLLGGGCGPVPPCLEDSRGLDPDESTSLGESVAEALGGVPLADMRQLHWFETAGVLDFAGRGTDTTVDWSLTPRLDTGRFVDSRDNPRYTNDDVNDCSDRIEVNATLRISTEDGWLDEPALDVVITFRQSGGTDRATWTAGEDLDVDDLAGQLSSGLSSSGGHDTLHIDGTVGPDGTTRLFLSTHSRVETNDAVAVGITELGCSSSQPDACEPPI